MSDRSVTPPITADQAARIAPGHGTVVHRKPLTVVISSDGDPEAAAEGITAVVDALVAEGDLAFGPVAAGLQQFVVDHQPSGVAAVLDVAPDAIAFLFDNAAAIGTSTTHRASGRSGWTTVFIEGESVSLVAGPGPERPVDPWSRLWAGTVAGQGVQVDLSRSSVPTALPAETPIAEPEHEPEIDPEVEPQQPAVIALDLFDPAELPPAQAAEGTDAADGADDEPPRRSPAFSDGPALDEIAGAFQVVSIDGEEPSGHNGSGVGGDEGFDRAPVEQDGSIDADPVVGQNGLADGMIDTGRLDEFDRQAPPEADEVPDTEPSLDDLVGGEHEADGNGAPPADDDPIAEGSPAVTESSEEAESADRGLDDPSPASDRTDDEIERHEGQGGDVESSAAADDQAVGAGAADEEGGEDGGSEPVIELDADPIDLSSAAMPSWNWPPPQPETEPSTYAPATADTAATVGKDARHRSEQARQPVPIGDIDDRPELDGAPLVDIEPAMETMSDPAPTKKPPKPGGLADLMTQHHPNRPDGLDPADLTGPDVDPPPPSADTGAVVQSPPPPQAEPIAGPPPMPSDLTAPRPAEPIAGPPPMPSDLPPPRPAEPIAGPPPMPSDLPPPPPGAMPIAGPPPMPERGERSANGDEPD